MSWNWDHLRYFLALADAQTLVAAAKQLDVSHTTVLRRVKSFEAELGSRLFEHVHNGYRLTMEGESLYAEAVKMKHVMEKVSRQIGGADTQAMGEVVITTTDTLAHEILPPWLLQLTKTHDGLRFSLKMLNEFSDIDNYEADIAVRSCKEPPGQLIGRRVGVIKFLACASVDYVRHHELREFPLDTRGHRFIVLDSTYKNTPFNQWLRTRLPGDTYCTTASSPLCAAALCRGGLGITIMPDYMLEGQDSLVRLPTIEPIISNDLWILSHADTRDTERVRIVRHFLQDRLVERFGPG